MGRQIIKQPNGKYCIFSSIVDNVTHYDMTEDEIVEEWVNEYREQIVEKVKSIISKLENGEKPYNNFTKSYHDMLSLIKEIHGAKASKEIKKLMEEDSETTN